MGRVLLALLFATGVYYGFYRDRASESLEGAIQQLTAAADEALTDLQW